jgi:hypothetical protein
MILRSGGEGCRQPAAIGWAGIFIVNKMKTANLLTLVVGRHASRARDAAPEQRYFQPPWLVEDLTSCFVVKARGGQELAFIYYEDDPRRRSIVKLLSRDEARRIAAAIAKLPEMV